MSDMSTSLTALLTEAAERLGTPGHKRSGHNLADPDKCRICKDNLLADRLAAAAEGNPAREQVTR